MRKGMHCRVSAGCMDEVDREMIEYPLFRSDIPLSAEQLPEGRKQQRPGSHPSGRRIYHNRYLLPLLRHIIEPEKSGGKREQNIGIFFLHIFQNIERAVIHHVNNRDERSFVIHVKSRKLTEE